MKKFLSMTLALIMTMALASPAFASDTIPPVDPEPEEGWIMPRIAIFTNTASSDNGRWDSSEFSATASNGNYIRFWHDNTTDEDVKVYLYKTDSGTDVRVKSMTVPANSSLSEVYYSSKAGSGTYKIVIEATVSGGDINGAVNVAQYVTRPN